MSSTFNYMGHTCSFALSPNPLGSNCFVVDIQVYDRGAWTVAKSITFWGTQGCKGINDQIEAELYRYLLDKAKKEECQRYTRCCCKCKCCKEAE